ncbi:VCBS repeat-containing protein [Limimaricola variabilis]|uniref:VCBS repeat-containing protein n=1 Tax=Limimaricola variabilis TaxID=1492771 RepID=A0ABR6HR33_9RHOB|nr:VCBS repeat-containing protein [Limimaricola variabilis]
MTITGTNDAPVASNDVYAGAALVEAGYLVAGNSSAAGNVLANDSDVDASDALSVQGVEAGDAVAGPPLTGGVGISVRGVYGSLLLSADGEWTYTLDDADPDTEALITGETGVETFTYTVADGRGGTDSAVLTLHVKGSDDNAPPVAADDAFAVDEDVVTTLAVLANDSDPNAGQVLSLARINGVAVAEGDMITTSHGTLTVGADGTLAYVPDAHYSGADSFTYVATDGLEESAPASVTVAVAAVADAPNLSLAPPGGGGGDLAPQPLATDVQVNTTTADNQQFSAVAALADGGWLVTWSSYFQDGSHWGIYAQRYAADGTTVGGEVRVNTTTAENQIFSDVAALADGGWLVTWSSYAQDGSGWGIYAQRYAADGTTVGGEVQVNTSTMSSQQYSDVEALADGGWLVTWSSYAQDGSGWGIYAQRYAADGTTVGGEVQVNTTTANHQIYSDVAALADGGWLVTWSSHNQDGSDWDIYAQRYAANGTAMGGEVQINTNSVSGQDYAAVAPLADGGWLVTWSSYAQDGSGWGIYAQRYAADGTTVGGEVQVNTTTANHQIYSDVAALADGGWLVTWSSHNQDGSDWDIYAQRYAANGTAMGGEVRINDATAGTQFHYGFPGGDMAAVLVGGDVVTVWDQNFGGGEIFLRRTALPAAADGEEDQPLALGLAAALADTDGSETLRLVLSGYPAGATFSFGTADGAVWVIENAENLDLSTLVMTPPVDWNGSFKLQVTAQATETSNGSMAETTATATYTIAPVNDAPVVRDESAFARLGESILIDVLANDTDLDGDALSVVGVVGDGYGSVAIEDGKLRFTAGGTAGTATIRYEVSDGTVTSTGQTTVTVGRASSATVGEDVFLQGNYMELGISGAGSLGSISSAPAGYHPNIGSSLSYVVDLDGWDAGGTGSPPRSGDATIPGAPEDAIVVGYRTGGSVFTGTGAKQMGLDQLGATTVDTSVGLDLSATTTGKLNDALGVKQVIALAPDATYYSTTVTLTNLTGGLLEDVRYMRSFDPDQDVVFHGTYNTLNDVLAQAGGGKDLAVAQAKGPASGISINLIAVDEGARASNFGFSNRDPYALAAFATPQDQNGASVDEAITLTFAAGDLAAGASVTKTFFTSMNGSGSANDMFVGTQGDDVINVGAGDDFVFALGGADQITLGAGDDVLYFGRGDGEDTVTDFRAGAATADRIDVSAFNLGTLAEIKARATESGGATIIDFGGGDRLRLEKVTLASLSIDDFIFA